MQFYVRAARSANGCLLLSPNPAFLPGAFRRDLGSAVVNLRPANFKSLSATFFPESESSGLHMNNQGPAAYPIWSFEHESALPTH
jgi:hypothetical protein